MSLLIKNGKVFLEKGFTKLDLHIDEGKIVHIAEEIYPSHKDIIVNAEDSYILPGFIDLITYIEKTKSIIFMNLMRLLNFCRVLRCKM